MTSAALPRRAVGVDRYHTKTDVFIGDRIFRDALRLDIRDGRSIRSPTGGYDCLATVVLVGPRLRSPPQLARVIGKVPVRPAASLLCAASPLASGAVVRLAAQAPSRSAGVHGASVLVAPLLGSDPWRRKW